MIPESLQDLQARKRQNIQEFIELLPVVLSDVLQNVRVLFLTAADKRLG